MEFLFVILILLAIPVLAIVALVIALGARESIRQLQERAPASDAEQYTYSLVWLVLGVALLAAGVVLRSQPARLASAAVVALTIGKVFLVDMAGLTGILRALSFIGLGVVLVGIGWLYQRLLFPPRGGAITSASTETGNG